MTPVDDQGFVEPKITIDDVRHRAQSVKDLATIESKEAAERFMRSTAGRTFVIVAGLVFLTASVAYFVGTRSGRAPYQD